MIMDSEKFHELVLQQLKILTEGQKELSDRLASVRTCLGAVEEGQARVETRLGTVEEGQARLETRLGTVEEGQARLETRLGAVEEGQARLETRLGAVEEGQARLETRLGTVEEGQVKLELRMENEVIEKIRALFDDREAQNERFGRIANTLDDISTDVRYLVARVVKLEKLAK